MVNIQKSSFFCTVCSGTPNTKDNFSVPTPDFFLAQEYICTSNINMSIQTLNTRTDKQHILRSPCTTQHPTTYTSDSLWHWDTKLKRQDATLAK